MKTPKNGSIRWTAHTTYVDIETGHVLRAKDAKNKHKYIIIKTEKHVTFNHNKTTGYIEYTSQCTRQPQTKLDFSANG